MDTSHSKGKRPRTSVKPGSTAASPAPSSEKGAYVEKSAYLISIAVKEDAPPFGSVRDGEFAPNERGRALSACWRELGRARAGLRPDAVLIGPRQVHGILFLASDGQDRPSLSEAVRLFKVLASLRLSQVDKASGPSAKRPGRIAKVQPKVQLQGALEIPGRISSNSPATETSASPRKSPAALWKKGYTERSLAGAADLAEARKALKALPNRS